MKKKAKVNLCLGIVMLILLLTSWLGGKAVNLYGRNNTCCISAHVGGLLVSARTEDSRLAVEPTPKPEFKTTEDELISFYSQKYSVDEQLVRCIIARESSFNHLAIGDNGQAVGLAQAHPYFWKAYRKIMGLDANLQLRQDKAESIKTLVYVLSIGGGRNWTAFSKCLKEEK